MKIGSKIRETRLESGLTLEELSKRSGIALASLSRIENEKMTGTLDSHMKICKALGITLPRLYEGLDEEEEEIQIQKENLRTEVSVHNKKSSSEMLISNVLNKKMMPIILKIQPDGVTDKQEGKIGTEKFIYVFNGEIEAIIGDKKYTLSKGDSLYFNSFLPHQFKNIGNSEAQCICVTSPPSV